MLPTPTELRALSGRYRDEAGTAPDAKTKGELLVFAFALAQAAQALESNVPMPEAKLLEYKRLIAAAQSNETEQIVKLPIAQLADDERRRISSWRMRAEELRAVADQFEVPSAQGTLRRLADNYDRLAVDAEARLIHLASRVTNQAG